MKRKRAGKAKRLSRDIISTLPQRIIESILSLLPTDEAARTSILSRDWRYKWTTVPKLELYHYGEKIDSRCTYLSYTYQVLLLHQGPIQELTLRMCEDCECFELDQIILHLAKNHTVKKLELHGWDIYAPFDLPKSVLSLHYLTDLVLSYANLDFEHQPMFNGCGNLRSLVLNEARISTKALLHLLSNCRSLKSSNLEIVMDELHLLGERCTIVELFKCLPVIEHLTVDTNSLLFWLDLGLVPRELPSFLFHLKYFYFIQMSFDNYGLPFLLALIKCSPNLEKIKIDIEGEDDYDEEYSLLWEKYSDVRLENLIEFEILSFRNLKVEMEFVKFVLDRAPKLKKLSICNEWILGQRRSKMIEVLLKALRASKEKSKMLKVVLDASPAALVTIYF